jgi:hypothetical protein
VCAENRKHAPLIVRREMKEAVPRQNAVEVLAQRKCPHVGDLPASLWEARFA